MESDAAFYIAQEEDAAKEIESVNNFDLEMVKKIEDWAATAINKANNTPAQDSHWEYQASFFIRNMCPSTLTSEATLRTKRAVELDPKNYFARISLYYSFSHAEAVEALTALKDELETYSGEESSQLLATVSIRLGIRLWNIGGDYEAAARAHVESLTYDVVSWEYMGVLKQYAENSSHEHTINFFRQLNERHSIWESSAFELYYYINDIFDDEHAIAKAADSTDGWDVVKTLFNLMLEGMERPELCKTVSQCYVQLGDCLSASSSASVRAERVAHYESAMDALKGIELTNGRGDKYALFSLVQQLSAVYLEHALMSEPGSEILESYLTKIAGLLDIADREGNILQATSPVCSLIVFNRKTGQFDDVVSKWTHKIILDVLDLLSDDDDDNDFEAYLYLLQLMIAMRDTENARIAVLMLKWETRKKMIREIEEATQATSSSNKNLARQAILDDGDQEEGGEDVEEVKKDEEKKDEYEEEEEDERENTVEQIKEGANEGDEETQEASEETDEAKEETDEAQDTEGADEDTEEADEDAEEADEDSAIGTWTVLCDGCTLELRAVDFAVYLCTECVSLMGFEPKCYELLKKGKMERQHECSMDHSFIYVPAWKPDQELLPGHVPLLETGVEGDGEVQQIGWMPLEEWKAKLKDLYVKN